MFTLNTIKLITQLVFLCSFSILFAQKSNTESIFLFGSEIGTGSAININTPISYANSSGYGFDFGTDEQVDIQKSGFTSSDFSVYFSVKLAEGNYRIEVTYDTTLKEEEIFVKAESRRLMVQFILPTDSLTQIKSFLVNLRTPNLENNESIILKERELTHLNWDEKLTLEFFGKVPIQRIRISAVENLPTIFLAGDSTVTDQDLEPWASWGQFITAYLKDQIVIANYAYSGASLSSFKASKRLEKITSLMKKGDYLFIEFGHNDQKQKGAGQGPWLNYTALLTEFVLAARERGAFPILLTPTERRFFTENEKLKSSHGAYPEAMRKVAVTLGVPLIDLTEITTTLYESWGDEHSKKAFVHYPANTFTGQDIELEDNTHFNGFGANEIALCVLEEIKNKKLDIAKYIKDEVSSYSPEHPNNSSSWKVPMGNRFEPTKPDGN